MGKVWRLWCKALGEKPSPCDRESDQIAAVRIIIFATYLTTNLFICAGVVRHWNDSPNYPRSQHLGNLGKLQEPLSGANRLLTP